jgi:formate dehydrogenase accessory protein FdhE
MHVDNEPMPQDPWQRRVERAEELAQRHSFAAEILRFYVPIAAFQRGLYRRLEGTSASRADSASRGPWNGSPPELPELLASFPHFLTMIEEHAPVQLAEFAHGLREGPENTRTELLNEYWNGADALPTSGLAEFSARAFLQPYAEFVRMRSELQWDGYTRSRCPFCSRKAGLGVLRQQGDGGRRSLICSFCLAEWQFRRILCPNCGEENHAKLPVYTATQLEHVRVECCETCKSYLKTVDLTKNGLAEPVIDEIAAVPLDLWAQEHGYSKLQANLMQM